jgi:hypothetical protein
LIIYKEGKFILSQVWRLKVQGLDILTMSSDSGRQKSKRETLHPQIAKEEREPTHAS